MAKNTLRITKAHSKPNPWLFIAETRALVAFAAR
jgi:hypothetical protein